MNTKERLVTRIFEVCCEEGLSKETIQSALFYCWDLASCFTLFAPGVADEQVSSGGRKSFASSIINSIFIKELERDYKLDEDERETILEWCIWLDKFYPLVEESTKGYFSGHRSAN